MIAIVIILVIISLLCFFFFWFITIRFLGVNKSSITFLIKICSVICIISIILIPIISSSFFAPIYKQNVSYFRLFWMWFFMLGLIFLILGLRILFLVRKMLKQMKSEGTQEKLKTKGVYVIVRHPTIFSWFVIYLGLSFIFDSLYGVILFPFLFLLLELHCVLKEKYILIKKHEKIYKSYIEKVPYRLISPPYNYLLFIIAFFVFYIGVINRAYIF
ncbi:hypothetical protein LCGC14_1081910 [marine sediment metagenome]|uniref:Steroid 5-alpha reductase C-terminal domain-containing protein n=1 Tax=marine sediment metagenome TaxID=412755 RepID=A0A0F9QKV5_9ZZZZ